MLNRLPEIPLLLCVCIPGDDESFRMDVEAAVHTVGPGAHVTQEGLAGVVTLLRVRYEDASVQPAVLAEPDSGTARQIWWYFHRDGRPSPVM